MAYIGKIPAAAAITASDLDPAVITGQPALAVSPADTDEFLISDAGVLKRLDASLIGGGATTLLSTTTVSIGSIIFIEYLIDSEIITILILIFGSIFYVWASIHLSEQVIFFIGGLGLVINLPRLITEILPDNIWPPLILFLVGGVLVVVGLYLNSIRANIKTTKP